MASKPAPGERTIAQTATPNERARSTSDDLTAHELADGEMACPVCFAPMPDLKGGKATICPNCGFKDSCCY